MSLSLYIYIYIYIDIHIHIIHTYIYIYRERESERDYSRALRALRAPCKRGNLAYVLDNPGVFGFTSGVLESPRCVTWCHIRCFGASSCAASRLLLNEL